MLASTVDPELRDAVRLDPELRDAVRLFTSRVGLSPENLGRIATAYPACLVRGVRGSVPDLTRFLEGLGVAHADLKLVLLRRPQLLGLKVEGNLRATVRFLLEEVCVAEQALAKLIVTCPLLLTLSVSAKLRPNLVLLRSYGVASPERLVCAWPQVLTLSRDSKIRPNVRFLLEEVRVPQEALGKVLSKKPQILGYSIENKLRPAVEFLTREMHVPGARLAEVVVRCPALLGFSVSGNLRPTLRFLASFHASSLHNASLIHAASSLQNAAVTLQTVEEQGAPSHVASHDGGAWRADAVWARHNPSSPLHAPSLENASVTLQTDAAWREHASFLLATVSRDASACHNPSSPRSASALHAPSPQNAAALLFPALLHNSSP
ncbi:mTERF-domain-containing protein, partial [Baffinella frigidus]